ncbi:AMP-binding protein, partial [Staphylococcus capitis]|uniref:AMP-binding protein n=1 Tax=Staphylococcus capitis TaxID=29388 RepID=UPI00301B3D28
GAYVPIDPNYPEDRINYILQDSQLNVLLTDCDIETTEKYEGKVIDITKPSVYEEQASHNLEHVTDVNDLIYVIYTSGTTGKPKGVMVSNINLINLVISYKDIYHLTSEDIVLQFASIAFDQSIWDIFNIILIGGTCCLVPTDTFRDPRKLEIYMLKHKVSVAALTPAFINELNADNFSHLRLLESGAEAPQLEILKKWEMPNRAIYNTYGPTEATVNALSYQLNGDETGSIPIGKPINNTQIYILQDNMICGLNIPGELCIAGKSVTKGYLNRPELTEEKFIDNPFGEGKLYRTG